MIMYVKCVNNKPYLHPPGEPIQEEPLISLTIGTVYKVLRRGEPNDPEDMLRIVDETFGEPGSEDGYLYPANYFELFQPNGRNGQTELLRCHHCSS